MSNRVLVVGNGSREQALAYRLARDSEGNLLRDVLVSPGNDGMSSFQTCVRPELEGAPGIIWIAGKLEANLVVLDSENDNVQSAAEILRGQGHLVFGPTSNRSLEGIAFERLPHVEENAATMSVSAICDGTNALLFPPLRIIGDSVTGVGDVPLAAYGPVVKLDNDAYLASIRESLIFPALKRMRDAGTPLRGILLIRFTEINEELCATQMVADFGDCETQTYMHGVRADLHSIMTSIAKEESLSRFPSDLLLNMTPTATVNVNARGYPMVQVSGERIELSEFDQEHQMVYFENVSRTPERQLVTTGGRVLSCTASADKIENALQKAYHLVSRVSFDGAQFRKDIAIT